MFLPPARHVRHRPLDGIFSPPGDCPRSPRNQTALHRASRPGPIVRLRTEIAFHSSRSPPPPQPRRPRLLLVSELRPVPLDTRGRNRKAPSWKLARMARWKNSLGKLLAIAVRKSAQLDSRFRQRRTRLSPPKIHARASALRRAPRRLAQRRRRFLHHPALRRASLHVAPENFLHLIPRPQFR